MIRKALQRWIPLPLAAVIAPLIAAWPQRAGAADQSWDGGASGAGSAWYTVTNWLSDTGFAGDVVGQTVTGEGAATDIATVNAGTNTQIGINITTGNLSLGAIDMNRSSGGNVTIGNSTATASGFLQLNGATVNSIANTLIRVTGSQDLTLAPTAGGTVAMNYRLGIANGLFTVDTGRTLTISGILEHATAGNGFTKNGVGTMVLSGANTYSGATTLSAGILRATTSASALGAGTLSLGGGELQLANDTALAFNRNTTVTANTQITSDRLTAGAGVTHTLGTLSIGAQTLTTARGGLATSGTGGITFGATTLTGASVFDTGANSILTLGVLAGNFNLTKQGAGQLIFNGTGTRSSGITTLTAGTLTLSNVSGLGTAATTLQLNGGTLDLATDTSVNAHNTTVGGNATINSNRATAGAAVTHTLGTLSVGAFTLNVTRGANSTSNNGVVAFGATTMTGNSIFAPATNAQLNLGAVGGAFNLTQNGAGTTVLTAAGNYTGTTLINDGALRIQNATALGSGTGLITVTNTSTSGSTDVNALQVSGGIAVNRNLMLENNGTTAGAARSYLQSTNNSNSNANTWSGTITFKGQSNQAIEAASAPLTLSGQLLNDGTTPSSAVFFRGTNTGTIGSTATVNLGTANFFKTDTGTWIVNNTANTWGLTAIADGQLQIGANDALPTGITLEIGQASGTNGRLELNGFNQTVPVVRTNISSSGTAHVIRNSNLTTASTLTFSNTGTSVLKNVNTFGTVSGLGALNLVSNGTGRTEFQDGLLEANSWTVNAGTLAFTGNTSRQLPGTLTGAAGAAVEKAGTGSLLARNTWNNAGTTNVTGGLLILSNGTAGAINVSDGAALAAGLNGGVVSATGLTFGTAAVSGFTPILGAPSTSAPISTGTLTANGTTVSVTPAGGSFTPGTYALIDYNTISGNGFGGFVLGPAGSYPHMTATLVDNTTDGRLDLNVTAADSLIWTGATNSTWDVNTTSNFALASAPGTAATFYQSDAVTFGNTSDVPAPGTPVTNRTITGGPVNNGNLTFTNSTGSDYSVANILIGAGGVIKTGTGVVTLSGNNAYLGGTSVTGGTLILSGSNTLAGTVSVTGGTLKIATSTDALRGVAVVNVSGAGTFDANGTAVGTRFQEIVFSGAGVGGNGAIVNNGTGITNNSHFTKYTMSGNATWGGSGRYDLVAGQTFNGGAFTLTKVGAGELWYNPNAGSVLENVIVNGGFFGTQGNNPLSTTATVTVNSGATHQQFGANSQQHKVVLNDGGILRQNNNASGTWTGQITLGGTSANRFIHAVTGGTINIAGKLTGTGGFTVNDIGTVNLQNAANDYAGDTVIAAAGTLNIAAAGSIPATTNLIINAGTFGTGAVNRTVAGLSGTGGTISGGGLMIVNQSANTSWTGTLNNTGLTKNGNGELTLGGTADNSGAGTLGTVNAGTLVLAKTGADLAAHSFGGGLTINNGGTAKLAGSATALTGSGANTPPTGAPANYVDQIYNNVSVVLNTGGTLDMGGRSESVAAVTGGGTITNSTAATVSRLYLGSAGGTNVSSTFNGIIQDGAGTVQVEKLGTGTTLTLAGANTFTGGYTQTQGNTLVSGSLGNTPVTVTSGTVTLNGTHGNGAITVSNGAVFSGSGTSTGSLTPASGANIAPGGVAVAAPATLTVGSLTLAGGVNLNLDFNTAGTAVDKVATTAANGLTLNGTNNNVNLLLGAGGWVSGTYPVLTYTGTLQGTGTAALALSNPVGHNTVNFVDDLAGNVNMQVTATANKWVGGAGNTWDTNSTLNWNAVDQKFLTGDAVVFDDSATTFTPNIAANQLPSGVTFDNTTPYTLTSSAAAVGIAGTGGLVKKNTGTVTITSGNSYTGVTDVQAGTLIANYNNGTATTVLSPSSLVSVASGATFRAIANDADFTFANALNGTGTVEFNGHATGGTAARQIAVTGNNSGFTGTMRLLAPASGTYRIAPNSVAAAGSGTIEVQSGAQFYAAAAAGTYTNNATISGTGFADASGNIGALRLEGVTWAGNINIAGSARIGAHGSTGTVSGNITGGDLSVNATNYNTTNYTMVFTGTNSYGTTSIGGAATAGTGSNTMRLNIGNGGTTGTLGNGSVTINGDGMNGVLAFDRSNGYTLAPGQTIAGAGSSINRTFLEFDTQGTGFNSNGNAITLGNAAAGGTVKIGVNRANASVTINGVFSAAGLSLGTGATATGATLTLAGGANASFNTVAMAPAATGAVMNIQPGAALTAASTFWIGEQPGFAGTVNQTGGNVNVGAHIRIGHWSNNTSTWNLSGGSLAVAANAVLATDPSGGAEQNGGVYLGIDGTGIVNQSNGTLTTDWVVLDNRGETAGTDQYNLSGGTLELRGQYGIALRNTSAAFNFTGGIIKNTGSGVNARIISTGAFVIGSGGTGTPTIDTNGATNSFTSTAVLTGSGTLAKAGAGTLNFNAASPAWTGNLQVDGGTVASSTGSGGLGSFTTAGRTITVNDGGTVSVGVNNIFGNGVGNANLPGIVINQGGMFSSTRYNVLGNVTLNGGTLTQASTDGPATYEGYQFRGNVSTGGSAPSLINTTNAKGNHLNTNTVFNVADVTGSPAADLTVSTPLLNQSGDFGSAAGGFTKQGLGTMVLTGISTYTGPTVIDAGTLRLDAGSSIATSSLLTVNTGGTLGGSGTAGAVSIAGGSLSPGASPGLLNTGSVTTSNTSSVVIEIGGLNAGTEYDRINTSGSVTINDSILVVSLINSYLPNSQDTFDIWLNDGGDAVTGTFAGLAEGTEIPIPSTSGGPGNGLDSDFWVISYLSGTGNDIRLTYVPEPSAALLAGALGLLALGRRRRE